MEARSSRRISASTFLALRRCRSRDLSVAKSIESHEPTAEGAVWPALAWSIARDLKISLRSKAELGVQLLFYVIVVALFPLATSPERSLLQAIGPGVL